MIKLRSELYEEVNVNMTDENKIKEEHMNLLKTAKKQLESAEKKLFVFLTNSAAKADWDRIASSMMMTMKTHKNKGEVNIRIIHSGVKNPFNSYNNVIRQMLKTKLRQIKHICNSTDDVIQEIRTKRLPKQVKLAKVDIKDFYQQGDQNTIAASAFNDHQKKDA